MALVKYRLVRGVKDLLPEKSEKVNTIENLARKIFKLYGYSEIRLPVLENQAIFTRGLGSNTEIVEKQIFKIEGKEGLCLRPEGTAQVVRAYIEHRLYIQRLVKLFYIGPMFRGERPQRGRLRQFNHIGAEVLGIKSPFLDAENISLADALLKNFGLGVKDYRLEINSLGCKNDQDKLKNTLFSKIEPFKNSLCDDCKRRLYSNVLRILDCKKNSCQEIVKSLNLNHSYLCNECRLYFDNVCKELNSLNINYRIVPSLVRGLDYYTQTVFEFTARRLGSQNAVAAGGRYDNLVSELSGPDKPACGFAVGLDRVLLLLEDKPAEINHPVFAAYTNEGVFGKAFQLIKLLREKGIPADMDFEKKSLKSQLRYFQKLGAEFVIIVGEEELKKNVYPLKYMRSSEQKDLDLESLIEELTLNFKGRDNKN